MTLYRNKKVKSITALKHLENLQNEYSAVKIICDQFTSNEIKDYGFKVLTNLKIVGNY
jgi:hypothetical protein